MYSHISFTCSQFGSAFRAMNSSTSKPSIRGGRATRFCLPLMNIVMYFRLRSRRARFSAAVSLRSRFMAMSQARMRVFECARVCLLLTILRRRFAHPLDDARVADARDGLLDPIHVNLMKPVVAEVEPVTKNTLPF